jgi:hypothetical protein
MQWPVFVSPQHQLSACAVWPQAGTVQQELPPHIPFRAHQVLEQWITKAKLSAAITKPHYLLQKHFTKPPNGCTNLKDREHFEASVF